jgi:hypothetical protein
MFRISIFWQHLSTIVRIKCLPNVFVLIRFEELIFKVFINSSSEWGYFYILTTFWPQVTYFGRLNFRYICSDGIHLHRTHIIPKTNGKKERHTHTHTHKYSTHNTSILQPTHLKEKNGNIFPCCVISNAPPYLDRQCLTYDI